jgi:SAM-dependent methyltransferase
MIADIGAGTGNYANALARLGYKVKAIEPSALMRSQATPALDVEWQDGTAEALPLPEQSVHGIVCILAIHHFSSLEKAAKEMQRVCSSGPIVILTIDPRLGDSFWLSKYFPAVYNRLFSAFPPINTICEMLSRGNDWKAELVGYRLPHDAIDITMHSGWNKPEIYLESSHRQNMSGFALATLEEFESGLEALRAALSTGEWEKRYGHLRTQLSADLGFRFIRLAAHEA